MKRGRPTETDKAHIQKVALGLFERRGYDRVTMEDIATAAKVSRRTVFRHFATKSDLVWHGLDELLATLKGAALRLRGRRRTVSEVIEALFVPVLGELEEPSREALARRHLLLIARAPMLLTNETLRQIEAFLARQLPAVGRAEPPLVARTLVGATFAALQWWAEHGQRMRAKDVVFAALRGISL